LIAPILEDESIYSFVNEIYNSKDEKNIEENKTKLQRNLKLLLNLEIKKIIKENPDYKKYFNRIIEIKNDDSEISIKM
jgi:hypothetical protein